MARDIDYAAAAVERAINEKFGRSNEPLDLQVVANETTISLRHQGQEVEGARSDLLAAVRKAETYADLWQVLTTLPR